MRFLVSDIQGESEADCGKTIKNMRSGALQALFWYNREKERKPMIISASRRTDIPRFYFEWFLNRLADGFVLVRNPMNYHQVSRVPLSPEVVDCIVFWTKNPEPMLEKLDCLGSYPYYVQFTLNPYGNEMECALPPKERLITTFRRLAEQVGPQRAVWRYSPVLLNEAYTAEAHLEFFTKTAKALQGYTEQCKLSFIDLYPKIRKRMAAHGVSAVAAGEQIALAREFAEIGRRNGIEVSACGTLDLAAAGVPPAKCIDDALISRITGYRYRLKKDPGQRSDCYCVKSVDVGAYDTCGNGCRYCYANVSDETVKKNMESYDPHAPMLCGTLLQGDKVAQRAAKSDRAGQMSVFDMDAGQEETWR